MSKKCQKYVAGQVLVPASSFFLSLHKTGITKNK